MNGFVWALIMLAMYFMPTIVAESRKHRSSTSVLVINLFLGWTLIGWVVALAIACNSNVEDRKRGY